MYKQHAEACRSMYTYIHKHTCTWIKVCMCSLSCVWLFETPWMVAHQAPVSMIFSRQESWVGCDLLYTHANLYGYVCICVCVYSRPPLSIISISTVSITHSQSRPKNIKWKVTEIIHVLSCILFWIVWKKVTLLYSVHPVQNPQQLILATHDIQASTPSWLEDSGSSEAFDPHLQIILIQHTSEGHQ